MGVNTSVSIHRCQYKARKDTTLKQKLQPTQPPVDSDQAAPRSLASRLRSTTSAPTAGGVKPSAATKTSSAKLCAAKLRLKKKDLRKKTYTGDALKERLSHRCCGLAKLCAAKRARTRSAAVAVGLLSPSAQLGRDRRGLARLRGRLQLIRRRLHNRRSDRWRSSTGALRPGRSSVSAESESCRRRHSARRRLAD